MRKSIGVGGPFWYGKRLFEKGSIFMCLCSSDCSGDWSTMLKQIRVTEKLNATEGVNNIWLECGLYYTVYSSVFTSNIAFLEKMLKRNEQHSQAHNYSKKSCCHIPRQLWPWEDTLHQLHKKNKHRQLISLIIWVSAEPPQCDSLS